jgi:hypothetical protein
MNRYILAKKKHMTAEEWKRYVSNEFQEYLNKNVKGLDWPGAKEVAKSPKKR